VHWSPRNFSLKFLPPAARSSRGWAQGSGEKGGAKPCRGDAPEHGEEDGIGERSRGSVPYYESAMLSANSGGAAASSLSSLAAFPVRVLRGEVCGRVGVYMGAMAWTRGKDCIGFGEESAEITLGKAPCSSRFVWRR
jgi:hypothetical protein